MNGMQLRAPVLGRRVALSDILNASEQAMPGGIGPVSESMQSACADQGRSIDAVGNANEIFFNLDGRRVWYQRADEFLYFVTTPDNLVLRTVRNVLAVSGVSAVVEQLHLDVHQYFNGACRIRLRDTDINAVLMALRLVGVRAVVR